ncbi:A disintegrin and metalloproteinase with thrombospondin motifs adt-1-like isoform X2 [Linepithema humile]|uniref:A disintegrin and metalloproteinase with thrombospondin motifs adt-1-like isoform X2 n=1 Tax=Linepithema humile TaxID=83485 RepID=UPI00351F5230
MFFIYKLVLIILLNGTYAYITQEIETILLPALNLRSTEKISLTLKVFGKQIQLNLRKNDQIVSKFKVWKYDATDITKELSELNASDSCYFIHKDQISTAAINFCQEHGWEGFIFLKDETLEIRPLRNDFAFLSSIDDLCVKKEINISFGKPHLIKKSLQLSADSSFHNSDNFKLKRRHVQNTQEKLNIELAVFFDEAAYRTFTLFLGKDENILRMLILAYVNRIQAVFHHPSLGVSIDILLVHLEIMEEQPLNLPVFDGNATRLLNSFCKYAESVNPPDDNDPNHWDVGLYLTGINIYSDDHSTLGSSNKKGMEHDSDYATPCHKDNYIMSASQLNQGQMTWSECSREVVKNIWYGSCLRDYTSSENLKNKLNHLRYHDLPGRQWTAKAQCEIYFRDEDANVVTLLDICKILQCETPHKKGIYLTGPSLEGTYCAPGKECRAGECVPVIVPPYIFKYCENDNWSEWKEDSCQSSCLKKSKGVRVKRRSCKHKNVKTSNCGGPYYDVVFCDDSMLCIENRRTIFEFTAFKCNEFISIVKRTHNTEWIVELESGPGVQVLHNIAEPWQACTIHCRKKNSSTPYAPRLEMLGINMDPYFPDGTWCHNKDGQDYYCRQHYCLPE